MRETSVRLLSSGGGQSGVMNQLQKTNIQIDVTEVLQLSFTRLCNSQHDPILYAS